MENIIVLSHYLGFLLVQSCHLMYAVEFLLKGIKKNSLSKVFIQYAKHVFIVSLLVTFPPIFDMGKGS